MAEEKKEKSSKKNTLLIIILLIIGCLGAFAASYLYFSSKNSEPKEKIVEEAYQECGDPMIINLADTSGKRYVKVKVTVGYDKKNKKLATELSEKTTVIRDAVIFHFKNLKSEDLKEEVEEEMKKDLIKSINEKITNGPIEGIYFDEYMMQ